MRRLLPVILVLSILLSAGSAHALAEPVTVCVLDSGCDIEGVAGWDFLSDSRDISDPLGHGTRVCSLIRDLAPGAEVIMLKCFASDMTFDEEAVIRALYAAVDEYGADVINMSWTVNAERPALYEAIRYAYESGAVLIAPVGNLSLSTPLGSATYPAAWEEAIGVGGVNLGEDGEPISSLFYLQNDSVFVCARADYDGEKGSSYAAPRVSAVVAVYLAESPDAAAEEIRHFLKGVALDLGEPGYDTVYGWGFVATDNNHRSYGNEDLIGTE